MDPLWWSVLLLVAGLGLLLLEVFVPSGGLLIVLALSAILGAIVLAFLGPDGLRRGSLMLAAAAISIPFVLWWAIRWWPHSPIGRATLNLAPHRQPEDILPETQEYRGLRPLLGRRGTARSLMLPSGDVQIGDDIYDAVSDGLPIERGQPVRVVGVDTNRLVVRAVDPDEPEEPPPVAPAADDVLAKPIDALGLEPLDPFA